MDDPQRSAYPKPEKGEVLRVLKAKKYDVVDSVVVEHQLATEDYHEIFVVPKTMSVRPGDLIYRPHRLAKMPAREATDEEECMYYLGHATAIASFDMLLDELPKFRRRRLLEEWARTLKKNYATTPLWEEALINLQTKGANRWNITLKSHTEMTNL